MNTGYPSGLEVSKKQSEEMDKNRGIRGYGKDPQERFQDPHFLF